MVGRGSCSVVLCLIPWRWNFLPNTGLESRKSEPFSRLCPLHADYKSTWPLPVFYRSFRIQTQILLPAQRALTHWASLQPFSLILNQKWPFSDCLLHHTSRPVRKDQPQGSRWRTWGGWGWWGHVKPSQGRLALPPGLCGVVWELGSVQHTGVTSSSKPSPLGWVPSAAQIILVIINAEHKNEV